MGSFPSFICLYLIFPYINLNADNLNADNLTTIFQFRVVIYFRGYDKKIRLFNELYIFSTPKLLF